MEFNMTIEEYKQEIKELQRGLKNGAELEWSSVERWIDGESLPKFNVTRKYNFNNFIVNTRVGISVKYFSKESIIVSIYVQHGSPEGSNLLEIIESGLEIDKNNKLEYVKGYVII